jgi:dTDP-L-rhamnose 4-epimerase
VLKKTTTQTRRLDLKVLITGGNGFIGSHLTGALAKRKLSVRVLCRSEQFKYAGCLPQDWQHTTELVKGDINDFDLLKELVKGVDVIFHKVSSVGIVASGQNSRNYVHTNIGGTAALVDALRQSEQSVKKIIIDSSAGVYGEGCYECPSCGPVRPLTRYQTDKYNSEALTAWDPPCPRCTGPIAPCATSEDAALLGESVYAVTKKAQEDLLAGACNRLGISLTIFRYSSVYGRGQSEANYCAALMRTLAAGKSPSITEDGLQTRDFISVDDVVTSNLLALDDQKEGVFRFNIASGEQTTLIDFATRVSLAVGNAVGREVPPPVVTGNFFPGDVRHCTCSLKAAKQELGFKPAVSLENGIADLAQLQAESEFANTSVRQ